MNDISADFPFTKRRVKLLASEMAYVETGHSAGVTVDDRWHARIYC